MTPTGHTHDGMPLRVMVALAPGDLNTLMYETDAT